MDRLRRDTMHVCMEDRTAIDVMGRIAELTGGSVLPPGYPRQRCMNDIARQHRETLDATRKPVAGFEAD